MFSSIFITTLITAVTGNLVRTSLMCQDFHCQNAAFNSENFRICQQIGCYNENPRPNPSSIISPPGNFPPIDFPPVNYPPGNFPPGNFPPGNFPPVNFPPGNSPPGNFPPGNSPPGNFPPVNFPPGNSPPGNFPPGVSPPGNFPPVNFPPGNSPPGNFPPGNFPPGNFPPVNFPPVNFPPGNSPPGNFPPVDFPPGISPPGNFPPVNFPPGNFPPRNFPPVNSPPGNFPPIDFPPGSSPPVNYPPVNAPSFPFQTPSTPYRDSVPPFYDPGPYSPSTFPQAFPPTMYPPVPSMPTPATYQNNVFPPYYNPGPYSPPVMQPSVPFGPQAPATGSNNMIPPYYGYYHSNSWYHHSAPAPHVNVPASIKKEAANLTYPPDGEKGENNSDWLVKGFDWPGWQVVATNTSEVALLKKGLKETVEDAGQSWKVVVSKHFKEQKKLLGFLNNLKTDFNKCKCVIALTKWFEAIGLSSNFGTYFKNWLNEIVKPDHGGNLNNIWNSQHQHQQQSHYNTPGYHGDPYLMYPYSMNSPNYFSSNPYAPNVNNVYGSWSAGISYPLTSMSNSLFGTIYPNVDTPYNNPHQHQWPASGSYPNGSPFFDAASQVDKKPVSITQQNSSTTNTNPLNVSVTFDLRQFNVSMCKSTVTKQHPVTLEDLLTKASQTNSCFTFTTVIYINNARREGKYLDSINGISVTDTTTWIISKRNGASDLNLDFEPASGDYFIINNTSV